MDSLLRVLGPNILGWGVLLALAVLLAYAIWLHRRNAVLKARLDAVNERLTHMQADVVRYLSTISKPGAETAAPPRDLARPVSDAKPPAPAAARVLVADDSPELLSLMQEILEGGGYSVRTAQTGVEAMESIMRDRPDLIVLDILMPQMNGLEVLQKMREAQLNIPVLIATAYGDAVATAGEFENVKGVILKPFHVTEFLSRVSEVCQQGRQR